MPVKLLSHMRRRVLIVLLAGSACLSVAVGSAIGHTERIRSFVGVYGKSESTAYTIELYGEVESDSEACKPHRKVKLFFRDDGTRTLQDVGTTSNSGYWAMAGGPAPVPDEWLVKVTKTRLEAPSGHRHICRSDVVTGVPAP